MNWLLLSFLFLPVASAESVFRYSLATEPSSLDPARLRSAEAGSVLPLLHAGLFRLTYDGKLKPEGALKCLRSPLKLTCDLSPQHTWSSGERVVAQDYVRAFHKLFEQSHPQASLLESLKNARFVLTGKKPASSLGVEAGSRHQLVFDFDQEDFDFEMKLSHAVLAPRGLTADQVTGPYKLSQWKAGSRLSFEQNKSYFVKMKRPRIEIVIVSDEETALSLYENKELHFLRRLGTVHLPQFKSRPDFREAQVARFDYIGFLPRIPVKLREALALSLDYEELQSLLHSPGRPGCPSFPDSYVDRPVCLQMNLAKAKEALAQVKDFSNLHLEYSAQGGRDHRRVFSWAQAQWKKNLGLKIEIRAQEGSVFLSRLRAHEAPLFRKGVSLPALSCLTALSVFAISSRENLISFSDPVFETILKKMQKRHVQDLTYKRWCREGLERLLDAYAIIPLGRFNFSMLARPEFRDWGTNELGEIDVSTLNTASPGP